MNFLQITQRLRRECRVIGSGPTTVDLTANNEEYARLIQWTNSAWMDIQLMRENWWWMRASASFPTVTGQPVYTLAQIATTGTLVNFGNWDKYTFRNYNTAAGIQSEICMDWLDYDNWRDLYQIGATRFTNSQPVEFTVTPLMGIGLGPTPIAGYTITGDYFKVATEMAVDADVPALPPQFHMAIVYRAMMFYGASEAAQEVYDTGMSEFKRMMNRVTVNQQGPVFVGPALA